MTDEPDASWHRPRGRWSIASHATTATRERLLLQAITARDSSAVLLLMRLLDEVPSAAMDALRKLARAGDHAVTAALLDRGDAVMIQTLVVPAGWANTQDRVQAALDRLPPSRRLEVAIEIMDQALTMEGDPPRLSGCAPWSRRGSGSARDGVGSRRPQAGSRLAAGQDGHRAGYPHRCIPQRHGRVLYARLLQARHAAHRQPSRHRG